MAITLPADPAPNGATPFLRDFGGVLTPSLGGPELRINRVGTRFGLRVTMPPLLSDEAGRLFVARLLQARFDRLLMEWPLLDFDPGTPGAPLISAAVSGGSVIGIKGLAAGYQVREGQFFSIVHGGRRYMHMFTAAATASGAGVIAAATIFPMLRSNLAVNDVLEIAKPMIEGNVLPGDELSWELDVARLVGLAFSVVEAA
ncbi:MAG: hypothetical protein AB7E60_15245 [Sphingobium sp.]|uniref:Uncharacterized protein n=1 Tax=Sphingobium jiangsuense TaxID=870476 RepID=A0A7W6FRR3_9SPHN|nr:hypothetical protein [Sphingobium jiangsuense]MBB3928320.1 hypothetical protein [Sphingobium jiangsuense]GLT01810.1 hypothetical protein GCM10007897_32080 [Sphingobium jiangsuense]